MKKIAFSQTANFKQASSKLEKLAKDFTKSLKAEYAVFKEEKHVEHREGFYFKGLLRSVWNTKTKVFLENFWKASGVFGSDGKVVSHGAFSQFVNEYDNAFRQAGVHSSPKDSIEVKGSLWYLYGLDSYKDLDSFTIKDACSVLVGPMVTVLILTNFGCVSTKNPDDILV